jgi:hypothetical protein
MPHAKPDSVKFRYFEYGWQFFQMQQFDWLRDTERCGDELEFYLLSVVTNDWAFIQKTRHITVTDHTVPTWHDCVTIPVIYTEIPWSKVPRVTINM